MPVSWVYPVFLPASLQLWLAVLPLGVPGWTCHGRALVTPEGHATSAANLCGECQQRLYNAPFFCFCGAGKLTRSLEHTISHPLGF